MRDNLGRFIKGHKINVGRLVGEYLICIKCKEKFYVPRHKLDRVKYCSQKCFKGHPGYNTGRTWFKKGFTPWNKGKSYKATWVVKEETKKKISKANKGQVPYIKGKTYKEVGRISKLKGANHPNWLGGKTSEAGKIRKSLEYRAWQNACLKRDNYTCIWCGQKYKNLNIDHIKPFALYPKLRFDINNGRTLCVPCHKKTDTYLKKFSNEERKRAMVL